MNTVDDDELLNRFRQWLDETRREAEQIERNGESLPALCAEEEVAPETDVGLYQLIEEFTAMRQELRLQTRSARGLDEQIQTLLAALGQALDGLRSVQPKEAEAAWSAGKALALALAELDEALDRGRQQLEKGARRLLDEPVDELLEELDQLHAGQGWMAKRMTGSYHERVCRLLAERRQADDRSSLLAALLEGYGLIQQRLARALAAQGISRITAAGRPVDPEQMIVVEAVEAPDRPPGAVVEVLRHGYLWNGRLLRYAEVRAARRNFDQYEET